MSQATHAYTTSTVTLPALVALGAAFERRVRELTVASWKAEDRLKAERQARHELRRRAEALVLPDAGLRHLCQALAMTALARGEAAFHGEAEEEFYEAADCLISAADHADMATAIDGDPSPAGGRPVPRFDDRAEAAA